MSAQQFNTNNSIQSILNYFLNRINYNNVYQLPYNNDALSIAAHIRTIERSQTLTGKNLLKWNVELEARKLQMHNNRIIKLATKEIWNFRLNDSQRDRFTVLANNAKKINQNILITNNADTLNRIAGINIPQQTNNLFEMNFFNGITFDDNSNLDYLMLPVGV